MNWRFRRGENILDSQMQPSAQVRDPRLYQVQALRALPGSVPEISDLPHLPPQSRQQGRDSRYAQVELVRPRRGVAGGLESFGNPEERQFADAGEFWKVAPAIIRSFPDDRRNEESI